jgi:hypothetical protein
MCNANPQWKVDNNIHPPSPNCGPFRILVLSQNFSPFKKPRNNYIYSSIFTLTKFKQNLCLLGGGVELIRKILLYGKLHMQLPCIGKSK